MKNQVWHNPAPTGGSVKQWLLWWCIDAKPSEGFTQFWNSGIVFGKERCMMHQMNLITST